MCKLRYICDIGKSGTGLGISKSAAVLRTEREKLQDKMAATTDTGLPQTDELPTTLRSGFQAYALGVS